jgi:hypothetical protein
MLHVHVVTAGPCPSTSTYPCCMSMPHITVHVHAARPCRCILSWVHVHRHAKGSCPCWMSMFMLHVYFPAPCPCSCCLSMSLLLADLSMLYVHLNAPFHVHAECQRPCYISIHTACHICMSTLHGMLYAHAACLCWKPLMHAQADCHCCMSIMLHEHVAWTCCLNVNMNMNMKITIDRKTNMNIKWKCT